MDEITSIAIKVLIGLLGIAGVIILLSWITNMRKKFNRERGEKGLRPGCIAGFVILGIIVLWKLLEMLEVSFPWIYWNKGL